MAEASELNDPWLVAVWPGMGNVALAAGGYLVAKLGATLVHELSAPDAFDVRSVDVKMGVTQTARLPRNMIFHWKSLSDAPDLIIFIGEAQPDTGGYAFCNVLMDYALQLGVKRVVTFAAMATQLHPSNDPRVFGAATEGDLLGDLREQKVDILEEAQISGLNGVLLAAASERRVPGICLLGELPFFAVGVANPKASLAALQVFAQLTKIDIDFSELQRQSDAVEEGLLELLEKMKEAAKEQEGEEAFMLPEFRVEGESEESGDDETVSGPSEPSLDEDARRRIERLFGQAQNDRTKAFRLKEELDRLGVFRQYEDRFLDLFRQAE